jgi:4-amino-4-deoxy-L-arabinose transferase-like glycosyltransferase
MISAAIAERARSPFARLAEALVDPARRERTTAALLVGYALVWSLYGTLAKGSQDVHVDMGEMFAWSHEPGLGTPKHPPLGAWAVGLWFSIMPRTDWSYYLLAMMMPTIGLWIAWRLTADYLDAEKRVAGIALLTFIPFLNFHALKYNANTILIPLWAATTFAFLRSFETRQIVWAAVAGVGGAGAILGKYWSACLIGALGLASLLDSRRSAYFRSPAPWTSILVGVAVVAPHIVWLFAHDFASIGYAGLRNSEPISVVLRSVVHFFAGFAAYIAPAVIGALLAIRRSLPAVRDMLLPSSPQRRLVNLVFFGPVLLAAIAALTLRVEVTPLWMMPAATLLPVVLFSSPFAHMRRNAVTWILGGAMVFPFIMLLAAPGVAMAIHRNGLQRHADHYKLLAQAVEASWRARTKSPLAVLGGDFNLVNGALFYLHGRATAYFIVAPALSPWIDETRIAREGIALVCPQEDATCVEALKARSAQAGVAPSDVTLVRHYLGVPGPPARYVIAVIPPSSHGPD